MRYVGGDECETPLHEQARAGAVGESQSRAVETSLGCCRGMAPYGRKASLYFVYGMGLLCSESHHRQCETGKMGVYKVSEVCNHLGGEVGQARGIRDKVSGGGRPGAKTHGDWQAAKRGGNQPSTLLVVSPQPCWCQQV